MPEFKSIRFQKLDKFNNMVFIVNGKNPNETENFNKLKQDYKALKKKYSETFLPIYYNEEYDYCTIRFYKNPKFKPEENCTYDVDYTIKVKTKVGRTACNAYDKPLGDTVSVGATDDSNRAGFAQKFVNIYLDKLTFVSRKKIDQGEVLNL